MNLFRIVNTDNFGGDYPDEKFLATVDSNGISRTCYFTRKEQADAIAAALNGPNAEHNPRYWKVVNESKPDEYRLQPGFEP